MTPQFALAHESLHCLTNLSTETRDLRLLRGDIKLFSDCEGSADLSVSPIRFCFTSHMLCRCAVWCTVSKGDMSWPVLDLSCGGRYPIKFNAYDL
ncbi:hypothetical protein STEG23_037627 [Scotinomys teguina]